MFFGDAHVNELLACRLALLGKEPDACRHCGMNHDNLRVGLDFFHQVVAEDCAVRFAATPVHYAGRDVEGGSPVETFLRVFGEAVALALERVDVHHHGLCGIFHLLECGDERFDVVTLFYIQVVKAEALEVIVLALALRGSEFREAPVKSAVVFGDGHFVVVYDHDKVRRVFARIVETFKRFAAAERTVADDGDDVALFAFDIAGGCKPERKAHRG